MFSFFVHSCICSIVVCIHTCSCFFTGKLVCVHGLTVMFMVLFFLHYLPLSLSAWFVVFPSDSVIKMFFILFCYPAVTSAEVGFGLSMRLSAS